ncbi:hypothetical protein C5748_16970, partial [Phyllobacterium phragmitis]
HCDLLEGLAVPQGDHLISGPYSRSRITAVIRSGRAGGLADRVIEIERARSLSGRNVIHEILVVSSALFPGLVERLPLASAIYILYQRAYSIIIVRADERLKVATATASTAEALGIKQGTSVLEVRRQAVDLLDLVVELRLSRSLTDNHEYFVTLS